MSTLYGYIPHIIIEYPLTGGIRNRQSESEDWHQSTKDIKKYRNSKGKDSIMVYMKQGISRMEFTPSKCIDRIHLLQSVKAQMGRCWPEPHICSNNTAK